MADGRRVAAGVLALVAGAAFAAIYFGFCVQTLRATSGKPPSIDSGFAFVAVGIAGIVTSALAAWFGVSFPPAPNQRVRLSILQLGQRLVPSASTVTAQNVVGWVFFVLYFGLAIFAGVAWQRKGSDLTPQVLKDLVAFAIGAATVIVAKVMT